MKLSGFLFFTFLILKLTGVISWSWLWVFSPIWIPVLLSIFIALLLLITILILVFTKRKSLVETENLLKIIKVRFIKFLS
jgi:hypothetical protein